MLQKFLPFLLVLAIPFFGNTQNTVCLNIEANPNLNDPALSAFTKYVNVFGIGIYAESSISDEKVKHVAAIFAEWLDNDEDGTADDPKVLAELTSRNALMPVFAREGSPGENTFFNNYMGNGVGAVCYDAEVIPSRPLTGRYDATLEENLHTISSVGYANAYPDIFGEGPNSGSSLTKAMDVARGGHFTTIPNPYPAGAWYTYDDATCNYNCMSTEYFYWGLTSKLGTQDYGSRCAEIANEWKLCTASQFESGDPILNDLFTNPTGYMIPTKAPDGNYCPTTGVLDIDPALADLKIFPNPANQTLQIQAAENLIAPMPFVIVNMTGQQVLTETTTFNRSTLDISDLPEGIYLLKSEGRQAVKFVIARLK